jgi:carbon-monoxide dehydrogenase large subunit
MPRDRENRMGDKGIGASVLRKEDARFMTGRGNYVADLKQAGALELAFLRSPVAHARITRIVKPAGAEDRVFTAADLAGVQPMRAPSKLPGYKASDYPALATGKVRYVGEPVACCIAATRAEAEDLAARVGFEYEELPVAVDMLAARKPGSPLVHQEWGDNIALETFNNGDVSKAAAAAAITVKKEYRTSRHAMVPMEGRAVVAEWDSRQDQLIVHTSCQVPHLIRTGLAKFLGLEQRQVRVIAPDVGGGFGLKTYVQPEELMCCWLTRRFNRPVRWIEDRREHLIADANCREHHYYITLYADRDGKLLGLEGEVTVDAGAYSIYPFTNCLEAAMAAGNLPGPYVVPAYRVRTFTVATNKPPLVPYRGVARPGVCFAMEMAMDALAHAVGREPHEVRLANIVPKITTPYTNVARKIFDSGDYPEALRRAATLIDVAAVRARQRKGEADGRLIGLGFGSYTEQTAHGTSVFASWGVQLVPGYEQAGAKLTPDGGLELRVGVQSHGQGMETTLAQVANEVLGVDPANIAVIHGDTGLTPYSTGTYASRSIVMAGGAVIRACRVLEGRIKTIGAHLLQCEAGQVAIRDAHVVGPRGQVPFSEVGRVWYMNPEELPADVDMGGVEAVVGYRPDPDHGTFSYSTHAAVVAVDPDLGSVEVLDYVVIEDCGTMVNPMVVAGQTYGGATQGIGTALFEESPYDATGQPLASTFADYHLPGATEAPRFRLEHMVTPSPHTEFGIKGMGEGGTIPTPAVIGNAVNDALRPLGAEIAETPITPRRVLGAIERARRARAA